MGVVILVLRLCSSYPQKLLVPIWITDKELESVASFRSWKRIPVVVYRSVHWHHHQIFTPFCFLFLQISIYVYWLNNLDLQAPEKWGSDCPLQPAWDQLVGLEEHRRRVPGDIHRQGMSDGYQGHLWSASLPTTRGSSRLLWQWFW